MIISEFNQVPIKRVDGKLLDLNFETASRKKSRWKTFKPKL